MKKSSKIKNRTILKTITSDSAQELGLYEIGSGTYGNCYLDETTGIIYKLFKIQPSDFSFISPFSLKKLKKLKLDRIAFPLNLIKGNSNIKGISYNYVKGKSLENFLQDNEELTANNFIEYYSKLITIIPYLTKKNVGIFDLNLGNIIINEYGFYIIDIDGWNVSKHLDYTINNIQEINSTMIEFLSYCNLVFDDPNNIIKNKKEFKMLFSTIICKIPIHLNLSEIMNEIQKLIKKSYTYKEFIFYLNNFIDCGFNLAISNLYSPYNIAMQSEKKHK